MRLLAVVAVALLGASVASGLLTEREYQSHFTSFFKTYNKRYSTDDFFHRYEIFKDNLDFIQTENGKNHTYWLDVNEYSDLTHHEFVRTFLGRLPSAGGARETYVRSNGIANNIDWRTKGAVTPVKNQGSCGSCWAFSATGAIEGYHFLQTGQLVGLSEQQIVDCCHDSSKGCSGGFEAAAINWVAKNKGNAQCAEKEYAYTAREGTCKRCTAVASVNGVKEISGAAALTASINNLPTTVAVDASARAWQSYRGGIFDTACGKQLNHAILAVGYDDQAYIVKNSWGQSWGDGGYIFMIRNKNMCGVEAEPSYPI